MNTVLKTYNLLPMGNTFIPSICLNQQVKGIVMSTKMGQEALVHVVFHQTELVLHLYHIMNPGLVGLL